MNDVVLNQDFAAKIEAAKKGKSESINIVPKYLKFETPGEEFTGAFLGAATRQDVDEATGEAKTVNVCSFVDEKKQVHETLSVFIFQRLQNVTPGAIVKIVYTGQQSVKNTANAKVKTFDIFIFA